VRAKHVAEAVQARLLDQVSVATGG
jgi:hypothetical protein